MSVGHRLRRNLRIAVVVCLAADLALAAWMLSPRAPSRSATRQQLEQAQAEYARLQLRVQQVKRLQQRVATGQEQMQQLMVAGIPMAADASSALLQEFSRMAASSQVQVSGAQFNPDPQAQLGLRRIQIALQVAGPYSGVVRFLNEMERSPMFFLIDQVSVTGSEGGETGAQGGAGSGDVKLQVQLSAYARI